MNAFDTANFPTIEPTELIAGDRWMWKRVDLGGDYPPASYSLKYSLRQDAADPAFEIDITATGSGMDFLIQVPSATTATYPAGRYRWQAYIVRTADSQRLNIASGVLKVKANSDSDATTDDRSHARRCLDSIEAALEAFTKDTVKSYSITTGAGSRTVTKHDIADLLVLRDRYRAEVKNEETAANVARGLGNPKNIGVRFHRV